MSQATALAVAERPDAQGNRQRVAQTRTARQALELAFEGIGGLPALIAWGKENRSEFYTKLWAPMARAFALQSAVDVRGFQFFLDLSAGEAGEPDSVGLRIEQAHEHIGSPARGTQAER